MKRTLVATIALLVFLIGGQSMAPAQSAIEVASSTATSAFPNGIRFQLQAIADAAFDDVRLIYMIAPDGVRNTRLPQCNGTTTVTCTAQLSGGPRDTIIPGAEITYFWRIISGGATQETEPQQITYEDSRFDWKTLTEDNMTLWYYSGSEDGARSVLEAAYESEQQSSALLQTTVDYPVKVFLYATAEDMQPAILSDNDEGVVTRGEVVYSDTAMVAADTAPEEIARHEIAHIVQRAALKGAYEAPDWAIEGMAVYMQSQPLGGQRDAIESAIRSGQVLSVRSMSSASSGAISGNVFLFYGEAWSLVKFLIDTYGDQKFGDFFRAIDAGAGDTGSLQQVYGFNQDGLENAWRESVGLPPRTAATPEDSDAVPASTSDDVASPSTSDDSDTNVVLIVGIIAVTVVIAGSLLGLGVYVARRLNW